MRQFLSLLAVFTFLLAGCTISRVGSDTSPRATSQSSPIITLPNGYPAIVVRGGTDTFTLAPLNDTTTIEGYDAFMLPAGLSTGSNPQLASTRLPPARHTLFQYQTPFKDQGLRNTCTSFGLAAAIEADLVRNNRVNRDGIDLSEQAIHAFCKQARLWSFHSNTGRTHTPTAMENYPISSGYLNVMEALDYLSVSGLNIPREAASPYEDFVEWPWIPQNSDVQFAGQLSQIDVNRMNLDPVGPPYHSTSTNVPGPFSTVGAYLPFEVSRDARYRVSGREKLGNDPLQFELSLAANKEIIISFSVVDSNPYPRDTNTIWRPGNLPQGQRAGGHCMILVGYDRTDPDDAFFWAKNSWGDSTFIKLSYDWLTGGFDGKINYGVRLQRTHVTKPSMPQPYTMIGRWFNGQDVGALPSGTLELFRIPKGRKDVNYPDGSGGYLENYRAGIYRVGRTIYRVNGKKMDPFDDTDHRFNFYIDLDNPNQYYDAKFTGAANQVAIVLNYPAPQDADEMEFVTRQGPPTNGVVFTGGMFKRSYIDPQPIIPIPYYVDGPNGKKYVGFRMLNRGYPSLEGASMVASIDGQPSLSRSFFGNQALSFDASDLLEIPNPQSGGVGILFKMAWSGPGMNGREDDFGAYFFIP